MRPLAVRFPPTDGVVVGWARTALAAYAAGLSVGRKRPDQFTARMVTVRNDSGPQEGVQSRRRYGFNVWSTDSVEAETMCADLMAFLTSAANGAPVTLIDNFTGPFEIDDDPQATVGNKNLYHFFFACRISVRASNA